MTPILAVDTAAGRVLEHGSNPRRTKHRFDTLGEVDAFHAKALALGGADEGAPGYRAPTFYFSYFRDLDGDKLCAYCMA